MPLKNCTNCNNLKPLKSFSKWKESGDGLRCHCKSCDKIKKDDYRRSRKGLIAHIYCHQRQSSEHRNHSMPNYDVYQLRAWAFKQKTFEGLYNNWLKSGCAKELIPSIDRIDDYKPYTFGNIQLMTWQENKDKGHADIKNGANNKRSKPVTQSTIGGAFIREFYSIMQAERDTGVYQSNISNAV